MSDALCSSSLMKPEQNRENNAIDVEWLSSAARNLDGGEPSPECPIMQTKSPAPFQAEGWACMQPGITE